MKVVVIGGQAAGCKVAARLKRLLPESQVTIIEMKSIISFGTCGMPFYAAGEVDFNDLLKTAHGTLRDEEYFLTNKGVLTLTNTYAERIDTSEKKVYITDLQTGIKSILDYDKLVFATGAKPVRPAFPMPDSERISYFHSPDDSKKFRDAARRGAIDRAAIIGGGSIGVELAEALTSMWGIETVVIERAGRLLPNLFDGDMSRLIEARLNKNGVQVLLKKNIKRITLNAEDKLTIDMGDESVDCGYAFACVGVSPEVSLAESSGIAVGKLGGIIVDERMRANLDGVYAAGDCVELKHAITGAPCHLPLGSLANKQARAIAGDIAGKESKFPPVVGAASIKVFELILASAGLTEEAAKRAGIDFATVVGSFLDRPEYHPEKKSLAAKLLYERGSKKLLGLQIIGEGEVTRYIDSFSTLLGFGATFNALFEIEHAYAPPHSAPLSPLFMLAAMAENQEDDGLRCISLREAASSNCQVIDVREPKEAQIHPVNLKSLNIPLGALAERIDSINRSHSLVMLCERGSRSYEAARLLKNKGFKKVAYIGGGAKFYSALSD